MKRLAMAALLALMVLALAGDSVLAKPPAGSAATCTASYDAMTQEEILELAEEVGVPEENALRMWESVNKNEDDWICAKKTGSPDPTHYNFVDNQALGLEER